MSTGEYARYNYGEDKMNKIVIAALMGLFVSNVAFAASPCETKADEKKLAGAARTSFVKKCEADAGAGGCEAKAAEKKLAGAAKNSFVKKCESDAKGNNALKVCESQAAEKKLAGAAKTSFTKKCVADATK